MKTLFAFLLLSSFSIGQRQVGSIRGTVIDEDDYGIPFMRIDVYSSEEQDSEIIESGFCDLDGRFQFNWIADGRYNLIISDRSEGYDSVRVTEVEVSIGQITFLDSIQMNKNLENWADIPMPMPAIRLLRLDTFGQSTVIESEDIRRD